MNFQLSNAVLIEGGGRWDGLKAEISSCSRKILPVPTKKLIIHLILLHCSGAG